MAPTAPAFCADCFHVCGATTASLSARTKALLRAANCVRHLRFRQFGGLPHGRCGYRVVRAWNFGDGTTDTNAVTCTLGSTVRDLPGGAHTLPTAAGASCDGDPRNVAATVAHRPTPDDGALPRRRTLRRQPGPTRRRFRCPQVGPGVVRWFDFRCRRSGVAGLGEECRHRSGDAHYSNDRHDEQRRLAQARCAPIFSRSRTAMPPGPFRQLF